jgi:hypothetical protein
MKTTADIPDSVLKEAMGFTKAWTKRSNRHRSKGL